MALTRAQESFAFAVSSQTSLTRATVRAWVQAEGGPDDNPLNIMRARGQLARYGTWQAAAAATIRLLNSNPSYQPILRIARSPNATVLQELRAIIESPWAAGHYTTRGSTNPGNILLGAYAAQNPRATSRSTSATPTVTEKELEDIARGVARGDIDPAALPPGWEIHGPDLTPGFDLPDIGGWVGDLTRWIAENAAVAFLYVVLSAAAAALILLGLMRATGTSRGQVAGAFRPSPDDIPF